MNLKGYDQQSLEACLKSYALMGWTGHVPSSCRDTIIAAIAPHLWGWPYRFESRKRRAGIDVVILGPYDGSGFSSAIDTSDALEYLPQGLSGFIWANRIQVLAPFYLTKSKYHKRKQIP